MSLLRDSRLSYVALVEYCDTTFTSGALFIASGCSVEANSAIVNLQSNVLLKLVPQPHCLHVLNNNLQNMGLQKP